MMPLIAWTVLGCLAVPAGAERVTAGDLAAAIPGLTPPSPEAAVAWAPAPGVARVFRVAELRRLAARLAWNVVPASDVCVERPVAPPDPERLLAALRQALPAAQIRLLDYSHQPLPEGEIEFPASGLRFSSADMLWNGYVRYAGNRRFALWARVEVRVTVVRVIAAVDLRPGRAIAPEELRTETRDEPPAAQKYISSIVEADGKWPRTLIRAGTAIGKTMLEAPRDVLCGDRVTVEVRSGATHLELEARAEGSGSVGDTIPVRNLESNKRFPARIEGKGRVSVALAPAK